MYVSWSYRGPLKVLPSSSSGGSGIPVDQTVYTHCHSHAGFPQNLAVTLIHLFALAALGSGYLQQVLAYGTLGELGSK